MANILRTQPLSCLGALHSKTLFRKGKVGMGQVLQLSLAEKVLPGLGLHLRIFGVVGVGSNKSLAVEPKVSEEAFITQIR